MLVFTCVNEIVVFLFFSLGNSCAYLYQMCAKIKRVEGTGGISSRMKVCMDPGIPTFSFVPKRCIRWRCTIRLFRSEKRDAGVSKSKRESKNGMVVRSSSITEGTTASVYIWPLATNRKASVNDFALLHVVIVILACMKDYLLNNPLLTLRLLALIIYGVAVGRSKCRQFFLFFSLGGCLPYFLIPLRPLHLSSFFCCRQFFPIFLFHDYPFFHTFLLHHDFHLFMTMYSLC